MPEVTFLVSITLEDISPSSILSEAENIHSDLESNFEVNSVVPWAKPSTGLTTEAIQQSAIVPPPVP